MISLIQGKYEYLPIIAPTERYVYNKAIKRVMSEKCIKPNDIISLCKATVNEKTIAFTNGIYPKILITNINTFETI